MNETKPTTGWNEVSWDWLREKCRRSDITRGKQEYWFGDPKVIEAYLTWAIEPQLVHALQMAYRKHHLEDDSIGWTELSDLLKDALCEAMGDEAFVEWMERIRPNERRQS